jgi:hypothetical protein
MFNPDDLLDRNGKILKGAALESKMSSLAKAGKILPEAVGDVMKTPWYKSLGPAMGAVSKTLPVINTKSDYIAPPRASNNQYTDSFGAPVKPSQFFNSVNNQQFESFYFGGGTSLDVYDATGLKLSWR